MVCTVVEADPPLGIAAAVKPLEEPVALGLIDAGAWSSTGQGEVLGVLHKPTVITPCSGRNSPRWSPGWSRRYRSRRRRSSPGTAHRRPRAPVQVRTLSSNFRGQLDQGTHRCRQVDRLYRWLPWRSSWKRMVSNWLTRRLVRSSPAIRKGQGLAPLGSSAGFQQVLRMHPQPPGACAFRGRRRQ